MKSRYHRMVLVCLSAVAVLSVCAAYRPASFNEKPKRGSWDAWDDQQMTVSTERPSITWQAFNAVDVGLSEIGRLRRRCADEIAASDWSIGCETLDRDYADFEVYKRFLPELGAKHARFFSGWAKTEQKKGVYDFAWLDRHIRETAAMKISPWLCLSYGNPVYGSDFRLGMKVKQVTDDPAAFAAWLRYCGACVERYRDVVEAWEIWNEPFNQGNEYALMVYETAKVIKRLQPKARVVVTAISFPADYKTVLEKLKKENALDLVDRFAYHPYVCKPEDRYDTVALPLRKLVKSYSPKYEVVQGEVGCPSQLEFQHALNSYPWTEYSQAKWNLRRWTSDAAHGIPSSVFTVIDLQYSFMLQSFGLIRSNTLNEFIYRRPSFYAAQNMFSFFDAETRPKGIERRTADGREITVAKFTRKGTHALMVWFSDRIPDDSTAYARTTFDVNDVSFNEPVLVDMVTGRVYALDALDYVAKDATMRFHNLPVRDCPVLIAERGTLDYVRMPPKDLPPVADASKRAETLKVFLDNEYGHRPASLEKAKVSFSAAEPDKAMMGGAAVRKRIRCDYEGPYGRDSFTFTAFLPTAVKKAPAMVFINNRDPKENIDPERVRKSGFWPAEEIVRRGYAAIAFWNGELSPDNEAKWKTRLVRCFERDSERTDTSWGQLSAWAWGASRVMDWIASEPRIDAKRVGVIGHSRGGKTALVAGILDTRFALVCSNDSGCGGAKLNRVELPKSEHVAQVTRLAPRWFCERFRTWAGREKTAPFDQHQWLSLVRPRLIAVHSATKDDWAGQEGERLAAELSGCTYDYYLREGVHDLTPEDWTKYLDFFDRARK